jgi:hypothetical protein
MKNASIAIDILEKLRTDSQKAVDELRAVEGAPKLLEDVKQVRDEAGRILDQLVVDLKGIKAKQVS